MRLQPRLLTCESNGQGQEEQKSARSQQVGTGLASRPLRVAFSPGPSRGLRRYQDPASHLGERRDRRQRRQAGRRGRVRTLGSRGTWLIVAASPVRRFDPYKRDATRITDLCDMLSAATANTIKEGTSMEDDDDMQADRPGLEAEGSGSDGGDEGI